jgi:hypothetical protein
MRTDTQARARWHPSRYVRVRMHMHMLMEYGYGYGYGVSTWGIDMGYGHGYGVGYGYFHVHAYIVFTQCARSRACMAAWRHALAWEVDGGMRRFIRCCRRMGMRAARHSRAGLRLRAYARLRIHTHVHVGLRVCASATTHIRPYTASRLRGYVDM